jgi:hypothetical protein
MKIAAFVIVIVLIIVGVLGFISPREFTIEKSLIINRPAYVVFSSVKNLKTHAEWNPWAKKDPNIKYEYVGTDGSIGSIVRWKGNDEVGEGEEQITSLVEGKRIDTELRFKEPMEAIHHSYIITKEMYDDQSEVTWGMKGKLSFPQNIFFHIRNVTTKLGYDFDEGLRILKAIQEKEFDKSKMADPEIK